MKKNTSIRSKTTGNIIEEYLPKFKKASTLTLARKIYNENKEVFNNVEHVRSLIRYRRKSSGNINRKKVLAKTYKTPPTKFNIPKSDAVPYKNYIISPKLNKGLVLSDIHFPYHHKASLETALEYASKQSIDFILLNGDITDCYQLSKWCRDPRKRNIKEEILMVKDFLIQLKKNFINVKIIYKEGNHEERLDSYVQQKAPELLDIDELKLPEMLGLKELDIDWVGDRRRIKYSKLYILHGHEYRFSFSNPVNAARGLFLRTNASALTSHFHQSSEHSETSVNDDLLTCWSVGCLCDLHPEYSRLNAKWNHGFSIVRNDQTHFFVENKRIIENTVV